ncbi:MULTISPECIES: ankyrin repeat domain-containing protein [Pseudanabaena]|uniref:Ankyrin n=2 Tax=Pseudanabaena TaxID=1152 RepID=L8N2I6_9CYAN|nr:MULTISPECIES: ankyrin repeat domain-containing protein [Pseudanabaena]ELS32955.1 Ankyrin [Pseudanabaena biceps PCC 7429]MDG3494833.1 ankyrin repeat domain-containing protein [Pseudanabaena catenata USMAC16]
MSNFIEVIDSIFKVAFGDTLEPDDSVFESLSLAAESGDTEFFRQLVEAESAKIRRKDQPTLLYSAVSVGKETVVKALIEAGADVHAKIEMFFTFDALETAIDKGFINIVKMLLDAGADPNWNNASPGLACVTKAVQKGYADILRLLLERGASVKFGTGFRLLVEAAQKSTPEIVQLLIEAGCNVNTRDYQEDTPLTVACKRANVEIVRVLIAAGANVNKTGMHEYTPLISLLYAEKLNKMLSSHGLAEKLADIEERVLEISKMLINAGADVNCLDSHHGTTPLMMAVQRNNIELVKFLIASNANVNMISQPDPKSLFVGQVKCTNALQLAIQQNLPEIV